MEECLLGRDNAEEEEEVHNDFCMGFEALLGSTTLFAIGDFVPMGLK